MNDLLAHSKIPSWGQVNRPLWNLIHKYAHGRVLDAGCARGWYVQALHEQGLEAYGCDLFDWSEWQTVPRKAYMQSNLPYLPFNDQCFDTVICLNVLEHITPIESVLRELSRVCKNEGNLLLAVPNCDNPSDMGWSGLTYHH